MATEYDIPELYLTPTTLTPRAAARRAALERARERPWLPPRPADAAAPGRGGAAWRNAGLTSELRQGVTPRPAATTECLAPGSLRPLCV